MRDQDESIPNVFTPEFLKRLSELPASRSVTAYEADHAGPWSVIKRADGFAIVKEGQSEPAALFQRFETAHLIAAILPGVARVSSVNYFFLSATIIFAGRHGSLSWTVAATDDGLILGKMVAA